MGLMVKSMTELTPSIDLASCQPKILNNCGCLVVVLDTKGLALERNRKNAFKHPDSLTAE